MDYRIVGAYAPIGQIQVTYSQDGVDVATYAIDVPIVDGAYVSGAALDSEIRSREPSWVVIRRQQAASATGFQEISQTASVAASVPLTLDQHKIAKKEAINAYRAVVLASEVEYNGMRYDSDKTSVARLTTLGSVLTAGAPLPDGFVWRSATNVDVAFSSADVFGLLGAIVSRVDAIFRRSWTKKAQVDACQTIEEINAIGWRESGVPIGAVEQSNPLLRVVVL